MSNYVPITKTTCEHIAEISANSDCRIGAFFLKAAMVPFIQAGYHWTITESEYNDITTIEMFSDALGVRLATVREVLAKHYYIDKDNLYPIQESSGGLKTLDFTTLSFRKTSRKKSEDKSKSDSKTKTYSQTEVVSESGKRDIDRSRTVDDSRTKDNTGTVTDVNSFDGTNTTTPNLTIENGEKNQLSPIGEYVDGAVSSGSIQYPTNVNSGKSTTTGDTTTVQDSDENRTRTDNLKEVESYDSSVSDVIGEENTKDGSKSTSYSDTDTASQSEQNEESGEESFEFYDVSTGEKVEFLKSIPADYLYNIIYNSVLPFILEYRSVY